MKETLARILGLVERIAAAVDVVGAPPAEGHMGDLRLAVWATNRWTTIQPCDHWKAFAPAQPGKFYPQVFTVDGVWCGDGEDFRHGGARYFASEAEALAIAGAVPWWAGRRVR